MIIKLNKLKSLKKQSNLQILNNFEAKNKNLKESNKKI